jgi:hypothetical protein
MTKGRAALVLAVFVAAIAAGGQVAAQAEPTHDGSLSTSSCSLGTGAISGGPDTKIIACSLGTGTPYKVKKKVNGKAQMGDECPSRLVRLRLVHGSTVITESKQFPVSGVGTKDDPKVPGLVREAARDKEHKKGLGDPGAWQATLRVPHFARTQVTDTVQASCGDFSKGSDYTFPHFYVTKLANTGFTAWPWTLLGAALLTVGAALLGAGRRRAAPGSA